MRAAKDVLDRTGHTTADQLDVFNTSITVDLDDLKEKAKGMTDDELAEAKGSIAFLLGLEEKA